MGIGAELIADGYSMFPPSSLAPCLAHPARPPALPHPAHYLAPKQKVRDQYYIICEGHHLPPPIPNFPDMKVRQRPAPPAQGLAAMEQQRSTQRRALSCTPPPLTLLLPSPPPPPCRSSPPPSCAC